MQETSWPPPLPNHVLLGPWIDVAPEYVRRMERLMGCRLEAMDVRARCMESGKIELVTAMRRVGPDEDAAYDEQLGGARAALAAAHGGSRAVG